MDRIPILKVGKALLVTVQVDMHDRLATALEEDLSARIVATGARGVLIDISGLDIVDSFMGRMLDNIAAVSRMLDAETVVVGMRPAVAITLVELGLELAGVRTALECRKRDGAPGAAPGRYGETRRRGLARWRLKRSPSRNSDDVVRVRQHVRMRAVEIGMSLVDQTKIVTAASELARNTLDYGGGGRVLVEIVQNGIRRGLRLIFEDEGPGMADVQAALDRRLQHRRRAGART